MGRTVNLGSRIQGLTKQWQLGLATGPLTLIHSGYRFGEAFRNPTREF